jgi:hypothetical protein
MDEAAITELGNFLIALAQICVSNSQKADAAEAVLQKNIQFQEAYRQELARMKARGQQTSLAKEIGRLQSVLRQKIET